MDPITICFIIFATGAHDCDWTVTYWEDYQDMLVYRQIQEPNFHMDSFMQGVKKMPGYTNYSEKEIHVSQQYDFADINSYHNNTSFGSAFAHEWLHASLYVQWWHLVDTATEPVGMCPCMFHSEITHG